MTQFSTLISRAVTTILFAYLILIGGTFNGLLMPQFRLQTVVMLGVLVTAWLLIRWRRGWRWHRTPLDVAFVIWIIAFAVSLLANNEVWRRSLMGLWYMGAYIGAWYVLLDALANRALDRHTLVDALLITTVIVVLFGYLQFGNWLAGGGGGLLLRPVSLFGNPNALAGFLVVPIPFILGRIQTPERRGRGLRRVVMGGYAFLTVGLLALSFSRGAWIGFAAALAVQIGLILLTYDRFSLRYWRAWWAARSRAGKLLASGAAAAVITAGAAAAFLVLSTLLTPGGRSLDLRTFIYDSALTAFAERPIAGGGLFTFGADLARLNSTPPTEPHSHAHSLPFNVAAELGLVGLTALAVTVVLALRTIRRNYLDLPPRERHVVISAAAACAGFGVHQLLDLPAMIPAIALTGLLALIVAAAPVTPTVWAARRGRFVTTGIALLWLGLIVSGLWSSSVYSQYMSVLTEAATSGDYRRGGEQLTAVINADPALAAYHHQQGMLYGLAAEAGDPSARDAAIVAFERFVAAQPEYVTGWANLAALSAAADDVERTTAALEEVLARAPTAWALTIGLGDLAESVGADALAQRIYEAGIQGNPNIILSPAWGDSSLRRELVAAAPPVADGAAALRLLDSGDVAAAQALWNASIFYNSGAPGAQFTSLRLALANGDIAAAEQHAQNIDGSVNAEYQAWRLVSQALIARANGDEVAATRHLDTANALFEPPPLGPDWDLGANVTYIQFLRSGIPRQFLPSVGYDGTDPLLRYALDTAQRAGNPR
ncbi:MAG: hypothetical protein GYB67_01570 [Chloroflexi bacterium]|nr:hypothetical protein [Chloroflexota bacterium]